MKPKEKIRTFIALELSPEVKKEISRIIGELKKSDAEVKWVRPETVHLTLIFLGEVSLETLERIKGRLGEIAKGTKGFDIALNALGTFPHWERAKVIWVGTSQGSETANDLAETVKRAMQEEGFEREIRAFKSHLTLGRIRGSKNKSKLEEISSKVDVKPISTHISSIVLFKSELTPRGAIHTPLFKFKLTG
jgi:2'-5' RNA ligase